MICPTCLNSIDLDTTRSGHGRHPSCPPVGKSADEIAADILAAVQRAIERQPRNHQRHVGPSELGTPCDRKLGYKLAGTPPANTKRDVPWKPWVGSAIHASLADAMAADEIGRFADNSETTPRWRVEERVTVGDINGTEISGTCDLFDSWTGTVVDHKTTTWNQIRENYRTHGPGPQYEIQTMLYGLGWENAGHRVTTVMVIFWVREGEFHQRHIWSAPYDRQVALDALARATAIDTSLASLGPDFTLPLLEPTAAYCGHCDWFKKNTTDLSRACPGVAATAARTTTPFDDLLPKEHVNA